MIDKELQKPDWGFYRLPEVLRVLPLSRSTFLSGVRQGLFPKPVRLGKRCSAWRVGDIREFLEYLAAVSR